MKSRSVTRKRVTVGAAGTGVLAGVVGLAVLAAPAGAGPAPSLPKISPQALVQSVMTAPSKAFGGTVEIDNELGLPSIPGMNGKTGMSALMGGTSTARVYSDGTGKVRMSRSAGNAGQTVVEDGKTVWFYDAADRSVDKWSLSGHGKEVAKRHESTVDPATAAKKMVGKLRESSKVTVGGTGSVAGRDAYELTLTPKPTEHTLVRQVRIAIDAQSRMPLQLDVYGNGSPDPALRIGFTSLTIGKQDASLFSFTPPAGSEVTPHTGKNADRHDSSPAVEPEVTGDGWDTVVTAKLPATMLADGKGGSGDGSGDAKDANPMQLLSKVGKHVSGPWGEGTVVTSKLGTALITSDGRVAAGLVPQQQLTTVLGAK